MGFMDFLFGSKDRMKQMPTRTPGQMQSLNQILGGGMRGDPLYQQGSSYLNQLMNMSPEAFQQFSAPYMRQFQEQTLPGIAERYAGVGGLSSSAMQQQMGGAGAGLEEQLAQLRSGLQQQGAGMALQYEQAPWEMQLNAANVSPYENIYMQGQPGVAQYFSKGFGEGLGGGLTGGMGGMFKGLSGMFGGGGQTSPQGYGGYGGYRGSYNLGMGR